MISYKIHNFISNYTYFITFLHRTWVFPSKSWTRCFLWSGPDSGLVGGCSWDIFNCQGTPQKVLCVITYRKLIDASEISRNIKFDVNLYNFSYNNSWFGFERCMSIRPVYGAFRNKCNVKFRNMFYLQHSCKQNIGISTYAVNN